MRPRYIAAHLIALFVVFTCNLSFAATAPNNPLIYTLRDCGISSLSGSSQSLAVANPNRKYLGIFNSGNANVYVNVAGGTAASSGVSSIPISSGNSLIMLGGSGIPRNLITVIGTAAQPLACFEGN